MKPNQVPGPRQEAHQTVRLQIDTKDAAPSIRIGFTDQRLGQMEKCELNTLRWRLFGRAAVWSRAGGKPTLKLAVRGQANRNWWREMLGKLTAPAQLPCSCLAPSLNVKNGIVQLHHSG